MFLVSRLVSFMVNIKTCYAQESGLEVFLHIFNVKIRAKFRDITYISVHNTDNPAAVEMEHTDSNFLKMLQLFR
uniref:Uncharacterized protein n=1 Tax=Arundo donax TaxID=35708 RepID=A0A0A9CNX4_ARUDO